MKKVKIFLIIFSVVTLMQISCSKDDNNPNHPVEVQFQLLNEAGEPTTLFREGEDIIFDYKVVNKSSEEVAWFWFRKTEEYLNIFEISHGRPDQEGKVIGTPHQNFKFYATGLQMLNGIQIPSHGEVALRMTWMGDWDKTIFFNLALDGMYELHGEETLKDSFFEYLYQPALPKGTYRVTLGHTLIFKNVPDLNVQKSIAFEVL